jgi:hypothetical protein
MTQELCFLDANAIQAVWDLVFIGLMPTMRTLLDITPAVHRCVISASCPAVFKTEGGKYCIIGKTLDPSEEGVSERVAGNETLIEISDALLEEAIEQELKKRGVV